MDVKQINFKQPKYVLPAILYPILVGLGYPITNMFSFEKADTVDPRLKTTEYLSSDLPEAHTDSILGDKMANSQDAYGNISDFTGMQNVEDDRDSLNRKEEYDSKYSDKEASVVEQQQRQYRDQLALRKMQNEVRENRSRDDGSSSFVSPVSSSDIERVQRKRRQREWEEMNRDLGGSTSYPSGGGGTGSMTGGTSGGSSPSMGGGSQQPIGYDNNGQPIYGSAGSQGGTSPSSSQGGGENGEEQAQKVTKKTKETSSYFNTVGVDKRKTKLITAIIDEDIKAVDGSRVRLRLLDDITIGEETVPKGTYIYVTMSGFSQQRVQGKIESIFFDEQIMKVSLTLYDTDGIEGLYVPQSSFRETKKDVISSATSGGNNLFDNTSSGTGIKSWANQTVTNASQRVMQALGTAAKKNRVKLKYGTRVYLMDTSEMDNRKKQEKN